MKKIIFLFLAICLFALPVKAQFGSGAFGSGGSSTFTSDLTLENGELIGNGTDGIICLEGAGGTNNEDLCFNLEINSNKIILQSNTGVNTISLFGMGILMADDQSLGFGNSGDISWVWETVGNDNFQLGLIVGSANSSGYFSLLEKSDMGNANRSPSGTSADPVLRVYSSDATQVDDYGDFSHNQEDFVITAGSGSVKFSHACVKLVSPDTSESVCCVDNSDTFSCTGI